MEVERIEELERSKPVACHYVSSMPVLLGGCDDNGMVFELRLYLSRIQKTDGLFHRIGKLYRGLRSYIKCRRPDTSGSRQLLGTRKLQDP